MRPRDVPSSWVKILPWYYTERTQPTRGAALQAALKEDEIAELGALLPHKVSKGGNGMKIKPIAAHLRVGVSKPSLDLTLLDDDGYQYGGLTIWETGEAELITRDGTIHLQLTTFAELWRALLDMAGE